MRRSPCAPTSVNHWWSKHRRTRVVCADKRLDSRGTQRHHHRPELRSMRAPVQLHATRPRSPSSFDRVHTMLDRFHERTSSSPHVIRSTARVPVDNSTCSHGESTNHGANITRRVVNPTRTAVNSTRLQVNSTRHDVAPTSLHVPHAHH